MSLMTKNHKTGDFILDRDGCEQWLESNVKPNHVRRILNILYDAMLIGEKVSKFVNVTERQLLRYRNMGVTLVEPTLALQAAVKREITQREYAEGFERLKSTSGNLVCEYNSLVEFLSHNETVGNLKKAIIETYRSVAGFDPCEEYLQSTIMMLWLNMHRQSQSIPI